MIWGFLSWADFGLAVFQDPFQLYDSIILSLMFPFIRYSINFISHGCKEKLRSKLYLYCVLHPVPVFKNSFICKGVEIKCIYLLNRTTNSSIGHLEGKMCHPKNWIFQVFGCCNPQYFPFLQGHSRCIWPVFLIFSNPILKCLGCSSALRMTWIYQT